MILKSAPLIDPLIGIRIAVLLPTTLMSGRLRRHDSRARSLSACRCLSAAVGLLADGAVSSVAGFCSSGLADFFSGAAGFVPSVVDAVEPVLASAAFAAAAPASATGAAGAAAASTAGGGGGGCGAIGAAGGAVGAGFGRTGNSAYPIPNTIAAVTPATSRPGPRAIPASVNRGARARIGPRPSG